MKLGKTLAVGDFTIWSEGEKDPVAHATVTYSIPPARTSTLGHEILRFAQDDRVLRYYNTVILSC